MPSSISNEDRAAARELMRIGAIALEDSNPPAQQLGIVLLHRAGELLKGTAPHAELDECDWQKHEQIALQISEYDLESPGQLEELQELLVGALEHAGAE